MDRAIAIPNVMILIRVAMLMVASFIIIHLFSVFGIFVAIAYPLWWFFFPTRTPCFFCRLTRLGYVCPTCHEVVASIGNAYPKRATSVIANAIMIFAFTLMSLGLVFAEGLALQRFGFWTPSKTANFVIPERGQYRLGELIPMKIEVTSMDTAINAIQTDISFNPDRLEVVEWNTAGSFVEIFIQKEINNDMGYARLTGGLPNPGFYATSGLYATVFLKGKQPGIATIDFLPTSMVLANDSQGTNILQKFGSASYLILPDELTPEEKAAQLDITSTGSSNVLGEETGTQLVFYEEEQPVSDDRVLGIVNEAQAVTGDEVGRQSWRATQQLSGLGWDLLKYLSPVFLLVIITFTLLTKLRNH